MKRTIPKAYHQTVHASHFGQNKLTYVGQGGRGGVLPPSPPLATYLEAYSESSQTCMMKLICKNS